MAAVGAAHLAPALATRQSLDEHVAHVDDDVSIRGQEWPVISQRGDSPNGPSGTLRHSDRVRARPNDAAPLSKPMRDARLRSSGDGLGLPGIVGDV